MAHPLRWPWGDDLLARREARRLHLLAAQVLLLLRGCRHDRRGATPLHGDDRGEAICRLARPVGGGVRLLPALGVRSSPPLEGHRLPEALPSECRHPRRLSEPTAPPHPPHQL